METAEKIGLLPGFDLVAGHTYFITLVILWLITPLGHNIVGFIGEGRWVPWSSARQYRSFFPGDLLLGVGGAGLLVVAVRLPSEERWYNSSWWHLIVLVGALIIAAGITVSEYRGGTYPKRAIISPTKIYHNGVLYVGYGYILVTTLVATVVGGWGNPAIIVSVGMALVFAAPWLVLVIMDSTLSSRQSHAKAVHAHREDWSPLWRR